MKRITKIYVAVMVLTIMLTNISYSVTYSICGMSSMSHCSCDMDGKDNQSSFKKVSCCTEEVKSISNNADFTKQLEDKQNSNVIQVVYILTESINLSNYTTKKENIVFQVPKRDIPVQFSRLLI